MKFSNSNESQVHEMSYDEMLECYCLNPYLFSRFGVRLCGYYPYRLDVSEMNTFHCQYCQ
jgi:hypothetical protein